MTNGLIKNKLSWKLSCFTKLQPVLVTREVPGIIYQI
jgi:hypothetical protein